MEKATILLVDDHAVVRAGIRNALEELPNIEVVGELDDGLNVLTTLAELEPDCLLIDVTMPNFEPISAIRQIRLQYPDLKILVVSAYDDDIYVQGLLSAGVNGYHLKDQPLSDLRLAVERVMAGKRWVTGRLLDALLNPNRPNLHQLPKLTPRQCDIVRLLQKGYDNLSIASEIGISVKTVENHLTRLYRQLNVQSRLEAVNFVREFPQILDNVGGGIRPKPTPSKPRNKTIAKTTILVVDDNSRFRSQLRRMLAKLAPNATVVEAANIAAAVQEAQRTLPALAFVDVVLGNEDGIHCTRQVKPFTKRVILMSAYPDREFHRRGMQAGATALLDKKDLDSSALHQILEDTLV